MPQPRCLREVMGSREPEEESGKEMVSQEEVGTNPVGSVAMMQSLGFILSAVKTTGRLYIRTRDAEPQPEEVTAGRLAGQP